MPTRKSRSAGQQQRDREQRADPDHHDRRRAARVQVADQRRDLAVDRQRVAEPRQAEHGRVAGRDAGSPRRRPRAGSAAARGATSCSNASATPTIGASTQSRPGCGRQRRRRRRARARRRARSAAISRTADQPLEAPAADRDLAGEARRGVEPAEGHEHEREREQRGPRARRAAERGRVGEHLGLEEQREAEREHEQLQREVGEHDSSRPLEAPRRAPRTLTTATPTITAAATQELRRAAADRRRRTPPRSRWSRTPSARSGSGSRAGSPSPRRSSTAR